MPMYPTRHIHRAVADPEFFLRGLTIGQHPQLSSDYEEDYVIGIRHPEFRGGAGAPLTPTGSATVEVCTSRIVCIERS